ncbi:MAG: hypothetical protein JWO36_2822 [Myxococcales bacterium]|nr:hypothetical protein [Myxococcales bacterium]
MAAIDSRPSDLHPTLSRSDVLENLFGSTAALESAQRELQKMLRDRGIFFGEGLLPTYAYAFVSTHDQIARWAQQAELLIAAAEHHTRQLISDALSEDTQSMSRENVELILTNPGYERTCVICRPDAIPVGPDLKFVELNCDSPAMMMFLDIVAQCLFELAPFAALHAVVKPPSAADILLDSLLGCYQEFGGKVSPTIAIVDWQGQKTRFEHQRLAEHFEARGYSTIVCDPRTFQLVDGKLEHEGRQVHLVYRRALASEMLSRRKDISALLDAYRDGTICMVNPLRSYLSSHKSLLTHLVAADLPRELKAAANLVPQTILLDNEETRAMVTSSPGKWVLKKSEGHGGMNVVLPMVSSRKSWRDAMDASSRDVWIAQDYLDVPRMAVPVVEGDSMVWQVKYFNWNPFVFGGRYAGGLVRVSTTPLINITQGGGLLPTLFT